MSSRGRGKGVLRRFDGWLRGSSSSAPHSTSFAERDDMMLDQTPTSDTPGGGESSAAGSHRPGDETSGSGLAPGIEVTIVGATFMSSASSSMTSAFKKYVDLEGVAWRFVSEQTKNVYWQEFKKVYRWDPTVYSDDDIYRVWYKKVRSRYADFVGDIKRDRYIKGCPDYITAETWAHWTAYWDTDEVKAKSAKAKKNRLSEPDGPGTDIVKHRGGSRSAVAHATALAKERGCSMKDVLRETFDTYHCRDGTYTSGKAQRIAEDVASRVSSLSQGLAEGSQPSPGDVSGIFVSVAANHEKNRIFGLGSLYGGPDMSFQSATSRPPPSYEEIQAQMRAEQEAKLQEMQAQMQAQLEAQQRSHQEQYEQMQRRMAQQEEQYDSQRHLLEEIYRSLRRDQRDPPPEP